jgi:low temperature requirement protein LtrA
MILFHHCSANVPGFGRLIDGIQRKKSRETMVIAVVVGILLCITIWYAFESTFTAFVIARLTAP